MKVVDKSLAHKKNLLGRLKNEIQLQSSLDHPCIVKLLHSFEDKDCIYLLLELCAGGDLYSHIKAETCLTEETTQLLCSQLVDGIAYLHQQGILHRDLKLGNLLLTEDRSSLKIADFGLAVKLNDAHEARHTICGTPNYISPEIINHQPFGGRVCLEGC